MEKINVNIKQGKVRPRINETIRKTLKLFDIKKEYINKYTEEKIIFVNIKKDTRKIIDLLENDIKTIQDIGSYNSKHDTDYNFSTYRAMFPYYVPQEIWSRCIPFQPRIPEESNMRFKYFKEGAPTFDEYVQMKNKSIYASREEIENFINDFESQYLSEDSKEVPMDLVNAFANIQRKKENGGRPKNAGPILKYDLDGNLIEKYKGRKECIVKNGLTKAALSQHLKGKRAKLKGYIYKEG